MTIQRWTFCPSKVTNRYRTIQRWIFSVHKLISGRRPQKLLWFFPPQKLICYRTFRKIILSRRNSTVNFDFRCLSRVRSAILQMTQILLWHFLVFRTANMHLNVNVRNWLKQSLFSSWFLLTSSLGCFDSNYPRTNATIYKFQSAFQSNLK